MSQTCPTVKVVSSEAPGGFKVINESDLTEDHELWTDDETVGRNVNGNDGPVQQLVKDGASIPFNEFKDRAAVLLGLGDKWTGGNLKKQAIVDMLLEHEREVKNKEE